MSSQRETVVIDATDLILGRLASHVAKLILTGERVAVINAENTVISGSKKNTVEKFKKRLEMRTLGSQKKAPKHARRPDTYVRRVVRGMIPWKKANGKSAYRRLKVYVGSPERIRSPAQTIPEARKVIRPSMTVGELMQTFGWKAS